MVSAKYLVVTVPISSFLFRELEISEPRKSAARKHRGWNLKPFASRAFALFRPPSHSTNAAPERTHTHSPHSARTQSPRDDFRSGKRHLAAAPHPNVAQTNTGSSLDPGAGRSARRRRDPCGPTNPLRIPGGAPFLQPGRVTSCRSPGASSAFHLTLFVPHCKPKREK